MEFLLQKLGKNWEFWRFWTFFFQKFLICDHETWFKGILSVLSGGGGGVRMAPVDQIFGPFSAPNKVKIGQYIGFWSTSLKSFH